MRLQILLVSVLVSAAHGFMFSPLMMALLRFRMGAQGTPMMTSPFALLGRMRRNQMANLRSIMTRRQNMIRNRMGIGRGSGQRQNIQTTATINPERLKPFGGSLGGIPQPSVVTVDNSPNVMSGIGAGILLNQLDYPATNVNNGGSSVIVGPLRQPPVTVDGAITGVNQIMAAGPNMVPQQVAMSNVFDIQQQQIAQNGIIGPIQAANIVAPQQQLVTTNVGPSVVEIAQQVPHIAMGQAQNLQATNMIASPQLQIGNGFTTNVGPSVIEVAQQVPNVAMGQIQNFQGTNLIAQPQQLANGFTTNAGIAQQQIQNAVMGQPQNLQGANMIAQQQQLGNGFTTNAGIAQQQLQNAVMGQAQNLQGANMIAQQQQLGNGFTTNIGSSVIGTAQPQLTNLAMNPAQTLQAANLIAAPQQQQFGNGFTTNAGPPVIGIAQQQVPNLAMGQVQNLQATNLIATPQQQLGNAFATNVGPSVMEATQQQVNILGNPTSTNQVGQMIMSDPQLVNLDNAIASTQQQISAIQNGIAEAKLRDQIIAMNNVAQQAQLRSGVSGSMVMNPTQQLVDANNAFNAQQQLVDANNAQQQITANNALNLEQQQVIDANNAINLQQQLVDANNAINAQQQLVDANNAINAQQQLVDANNAINAQQKIIDANNAINLQQQLVDANNAFNAEQQLIDANNAINAQQQLVDANNALNLEQQQIIDINNAITLQQQLANAGNPTQQQMQQQEIVSKEQFQQPQLLELNNAIQNPLRGDVSTVLSPEQQQVGSALIGPNNVFDPSQQQPTYIGMAAEPQPQQIGPFVDIGAVQQATGEQQAIGTNVEPGNTQMSEIANVAGINEQLTGASMGQQTPFGPNNPMNPLQQYGQVIGPNGPIDPLWQMGTIPGQPGGIPYIDPMTGFVQDPYAQQMLYSNALTNPAFVNGVPQPSGQIVDQPAPSQQPGAVQTPTGQAITQTLKQGETLLAQGSLAARQPILNTQPQQVGAQSQLGPWDPTQLQNTLQEPWLSNLQPDPNQPYLVNDPSLYGLQKALQNNLNIQMRPEFQYVYADSQQPNGVMSNSAAAAAIQVPTPAQLGQSVQQPQATQLTSSTQITNMATGITNTASSPQQSVVALDTPVVPQATATASGTVQQNGPLSDQSLQYRQAILDSILSSLQPQVVYNPINGFDVPADASLASTAVQSNNPTLIAAASGGQVAEKQSVLSSMMSAPLLADIGQNPTSPQPSFTVSDVLRNLAAGGQVANLPVQKTILADKIPTNVQPDQQAVIAGQMNLNIMTTPSPLPIATQNPIQYAAQRPLVQQVPYYGAPRQSSQSAYMQPNDFWGEMALASAIFNHPKQPLKPKQQQENSQKQKQQQQMLDSLIQSIMLASMQPKQGAVKQATSAIKLPTVVTQGDLKPFLPTSIKQNSPTSLLSTVQKPSTQEASVKVEPELSTKQNMTTFSRNLGSPLQPATLGITLPPVSPQTKDNLSSSVVRSPQAESNFITKVPLFNA